MSILFGSAALVLCGLIGGACTARPAESHGSQQTSPTTRGTTRIYYVAADDVVWDYAPSGVNQITNRPFEAEALVFTTPGSMALGRVYKKSLEMA